MDYNVAMRIFPRKVDIEMAKLSATTNMTVGAPRRVITRFAVPIFLSQLFQQLYNSADSLIVGNFLGKEALAAVGSSGSLSFLLVSFISGVSLGSGVVISRYFGAEDDSMVSKAIHTTVAGGVIAGVFISVFGVAVTPVVLRWMGTAADVMPHSVAYFRWFFAGGLSIVMYNGLRNIMTALGDSRRPLIYLIISSVLNILLDLLFVGVFRWGVGSAAIATTIAQSVSAVLCLVHLCSKNMEYRLEWKKLHIHPGILREILRCGVPSGVQNSVIGFANVLVQTNINSFGADAMAACGAYSKLEGFAFLPITCFSMALTTYISQNLGAGKHDRAREGARFGILASCLLAEVIGGIMVLGAPFFIRLFNSQSEVVAIGARQIRVEALFYFLLSFDHCIAGICRGAGKASVPMVIMLSIWCVLRIAYITAAMHFRHVITLLFWAYPITWGISSIFFLLYYLKSDWVHGFDNRF